MKTWEVLRTEVQRECNIEGEDFVSAEELLTWANDAKDEAEAEIVSLYDRYMESETTISLVQGTSIYALPADIYAAKITGVYFNNGSEKYEVRPIKDKLDLLSVDANHCYRYRITNVTGSGLSFKLYPTAKATDSSSMSMFYIRESADIVDDADVMDIPIAEAFIKQYIKDKVKDKELGPSGGGGRSPALEKQKSLLIESLTQMIPDDSAGEIEVDASFYEVAGDYYD